MSEKNTKWNDQMPKQVQTAARFTSEQIDDVLVKSRMH